MLHPSLVLEDGESSDAGSSGSRTVNVDELIKKFNLNNDGGDSPNAAAFAEGVLTNLADDETSECPICFDVMEIPTIIPGCAHQWWVVSGTAL